MGSISHKKKLWISLRAHECRVLTPRRRIPKFRHHDKAARSKGSASKEHGVKTAQRRNTTEDNSTRRKAQPQNGASTNENGIVRKLHACHELYQTVEHITSGSTLQRVAHDSYTTWTALTGSTFCFDGACMMSHETSFYSRTTKLRSDEKSCEFLFHNNEKTNLQCSFSFLYGRQ